MAIALSDNLQINFPKPTDARLYNNLTPYTSSAQVTGSIDINYRFLGLTVLVSSSTEIAEYWWKEGINDNQLILKTTGTEGTFLTTASNEGNGNVLTISKSDGSGYQITIDTGSAFTSYNFTASFENETSININHNLGFKYVILQVFDDLDNQIIPSEINLIDTASAAITFSEAVSGTVVATLGGATFSNLQVPGGTVNSVQYNDGGSNWGGNNKFQFDGTTVAIFDPTETRYAFLTETSLFNSSNVTQKTLLDDNYVEEFTTTTTGVQFTGNILAGKIFDVTNVTPYDIAFLSGSDNAWYPVTGNSASLDSRLLGVILSEGDILTEGYITVAAVASSATDAPLIHGTLEPGSPVYIGVDTPNTQPYLSTTRPNSAGKIVRIVGHLIYQNVTTDSDYWLMYFRPDHTWVEITTP